MLKLVEGNLFAMYYDDDKNYSPKNFSFCFELVEHGMTIFF
jgi:hypothetical protein